MAISYEEAMSTLQSMFSSQGYTKQQLDTVLRHFGGHMENCVDYILVHGVGSPEELIRKLIRKERISRELSPANTIPDVGEMAWPWCK